MFINPYQHATVDIGKWYKANFHAHAGTEDDWYDIDEVFAAYQQDDYDVLTISNQYRLTDTAEYAKKHGMSLFNGFEYIRDHDLLCIGVNSYFEGSHQEIIDRCLAEGGLAIICHPNYLEKGWWPLTQMLSLQGYVGIEIMNPVIYKVGGSGLATDTWDFLLTTRKLVWGFANDDFHRWPDISKAWNMIYAPSAGYQDVKAALHQGCFYASTGLYLERLEFTQGTIEVTVDARKNYVKNHTFQFTGKDGSLLERQNGEFGRYRLKGDELYVRVQVISEHGAMLWTQPVYDSVMQRP